MVFSLLIMVFFVTGFGEAKNWGENGSYVAKNEHAPSDDVISRSKVVPCSDGGLRPLLLLPIVLLGAVACCLRACEEFSLERRYWNSAERCKRSQHKLQQHFDARKPDWTCSNCGCTTLPTLPILCCSECAMEVCEACACMLPARGSVVRQLFHSDVETPDSLGQLPIGPPVGQAPLSKCTFPRSASIVFGLSLVFFCLQGWLHAPLEGLFRSYFLGQALVCSLQVCYLLWLMAMPDQKGGGCWCCVTLVVIAWTVFGFRLWNSSPGKVKSCFWTLDWFYAGLAASICFSILALLSKADVQAEAKASAESLLQHGKGVAEEAGSESACLMSRERDNGSPQLTGQSDAVVPDAA